jgi:hypothetical protein
MSQIASFPDIPENFGNLPPIVVLLLFQIGLPGVALVLTYGQLISQIFVEEFTLQFLNMYGAEFVVRLSLGDIPFLELSYPILIIATIIMIFALIIYHIYIYIYIYTYIYIYIYMLTLYRC